MLNLLAGDLTAFANAIGAGGMGLAKKFFPWFDNPSKSCGDMAGTNPTTLVREYGGDALVKCTELTFASRSITMTDEAGVVAYGGTKVYDMPAGNILILGATANLTILKSGAGINADFGSGLARC